MQYILVTGGCGYIGSHTVVQLLEKNFNVIIIDNLCNSKEDVLLGIQKITQKQPIFYKYDLKDINILREIFRKYNIIRVIHFASLKAVKESIEEPLKYYSNNLIATLNLLQVMEENNCKNIVFSSSATVYGNQGKSPLTEDMETGKNITNPYGKTKYMIEQILQDLHSSWNVIILRYFNPIGCHPSGLIGENPNSIPNNLFPYLLKVVKGELKELKIFGDDYNTPDGTCVRDFIHVVDLAQAHVSVLEKENGKFIYNIGTGNGSSVLNLIKTFEKVNKTKINYSFDKRRDGDVESLYSSSQKIESDLGWKTSYNLEEMCEHGYKYTIQN